MEEELFEDKELGEAGPYTMSRSLGVTLRQWSKHSILRGEEQRNPEMHQMF